MAEKWMIHLSEDSLWRHMEEFATKEEAIQYVTEHYDRLYRDEFGESFDEEGMRRVAYVGKSVPYVTGIDVDHVLEEVSCTAYDEVGEVVDDFLRYVKKEEKDELEERLNEVFQKWMEDTDHQPSFYKIIGVEEVDVDERIGGEEDGKEKEEKQEKQAK